MSTLSTTNLKNPASSSNNIVLGADGSVSLELSSLNGGALAGFRNRIINGNFDFWQRGTSFTNAEYTADRWFNDRVGTTHTATRQAFTLGQTDVPGEPTYYHRTVVSSVAGASNYANTQQSIEDVRTFAGQQVTVSFWAKVDATKNIAVELAQVFGSGGSPSTLVTAIGTTKVSIGTSWQKVTVTATVPSISSKTLGTDNNSRLSLLIWFDAGSTFNSRTDSLGQQSGTFEIAQVQIEPGSVATPFEQRPIGTELALCQRYFETLNGGTVKAAGDGPAGSEGSRQYFGFATTKRVAATMAYPASSASNCNLASNSATNGFNVTATIIATGTFGYDYGAGTVTASAEL